VIDVAGIARRLGVIRDEIAVAEKEAGRAPNTVTLVAVTKKLSVDQVRAAAAAGQRDFGENYFQEGVAKMETVGIPELRWHLIGSLQSNKAARAARAFHMLHSVATESVARAISREMEATGRKCRVLLQVHLGGGSNRSGVAFEEAEAVARSLTALPGLSLEGVMGVASPELPARPQFARLSRLLETLRTLGLPRAPLGEMSAGMTSDYRDAIAEGATIVRIGTAIFGDRV
jgi:pyridoxal phosphate enzyme (YggS family)